MKLDARMVRAAKQFEANKDVRSYLCGFNVTSKYIQATNGHVAVQMEHGEAKVKKGIYFIKSPIPAATDKVEFIITKRITCVKFLDFHGLELGVASLNVIDGRFPNINERVLDKLLAKEIDNTDIPRINSDYLALISKAFKFKLPTVDFEFRGVNEGVIAKLGNNMAKEAYGNPTIILMPVRKD